MDREDLSYIAEAYNSIYGGNLNEGHPNFFDRRGDKVSPEQFYKIVDVFVSFAKRNLKLKKIPNINFVSDSKFSQKHAAFGVIRGKDKIFVEILDRHPMDILRTLAHELIHYSQHEHNINGTGHAGSKTENDANMRAGKLLRDFGSIHAYLFKLPPVRSKT